jgi:hypothetical protein
VKPVLRLPLDGAQDGREKRGRWGDQPAAAQDAGQKRHWRWEEVLTCGAKLSATGERREVECWAAERKWAEQEKRAGGLLEREERWSG